jgi:hypothetical protein
MPDNDTNNTGGQTNAGANNQSQSGSAQTGADGTQSGQQTSQTNTGQGAATPGGQQTSTGTGDQQTGGTVVKAPGADAGQQTSTQQTQVTPDWPQDWRNKLAGADDKDGKVLKQLERFASPGDLLRSYNELQAKLNSGQLKTPLPENPTPEQLATYRKDNGIPEAADKYDLTLKDGLVVGEQDKPIINNLLGIMHQHNLPQGVVSDILAAYYQQEKSYLTTLETQTAENHRQTEDILRKDWGDEYRPEVNRIENLLNTFSPEAQAAIQFGRDDKGMPLLDNPHFLRDMAVQARIINPVSTVVAGGGANQMTSVETELAQIQGMMGDRESKYWKGPEADKLQARCRELLDWKERQKIGGRAA